MDDTLDALDGGKNDNDRNILLIGSLPVIELGLDLEVPLAFPEGFTGDFDGAVCVSLTDCGTMRSDTVELVEIDFSVFSETHSEASSWSEHEVSEQQSQSGGVSLSGASADALVFDSASYDEQTYRIVEVGGGAQKGLRVLTATNVSGAVVANGTNVARARTGTLSAAGLSSNQLLQNNTITQIGRW